MATKAAWENGQVYVKKDDVIIDAEQWYLFFAPTNRFSAKTKKHRE